MKTVKFLSQGVLLGISLGYVALFSFKTYPDGDPDPISDKNMSFSELASKIHTHVQTWPLDFMTFSDIESKMVKIYTLFKTKTAKKLYPHCILSRGVLPLHWQDAEPLP